MDQSQIKSGASIYSMYFFIPVYSRQMCWLIWVCFYFTQMGKLEAFSVGNDRFFMDLANILDAVSDLYNSFYSWCVVSVVYLWFTWYVWWAWCTCGSLVMCGERGVPVVNSWRVARVVYLWFILEVFASVVCVLIQQSISYCLLSHTSKYIKVTKYNICMSLEANSAIHIFIVECCS